MGKRYHGKSAAREARGRTLANEVLLGDSRGGFSAAELFAPALERNGFVASPAVADLILDGKPDDVIEARYDGLRVGFNTAR